ncbi:unnamed protein product [Closterium sp. NIES-53]
MKQSAVPTKYWPFAMAQAVWLHNMLSSKALPNNSSPFKEWTRKHPDTRMLRVFGCMVQYRPHTARTGKFEDRARWGIHLGIESEYHAWTILDFATHQLTRSRDCIFYERLTLPLYRQHRAARNAPDNIFQGQHSFANDEDDVDVAGEQPTKPAADMADEATFIPVTEQFGTPAYFPTNIDPHEAVQAQHNYASAEMHSPMNEDSTYDSSRDTFRDISGDDDGVVEVTTTAETNLTGLRILGLAVAVRSNHILIELGFQQLPHDQGMYRLESRGHFILLVAYVDDLLYTGDDTDLLDRFERKIQEKLEVTIDHEVTQFLGLNVTQTADTIHLSAAKYAETLAKKFGIAPVSVTTPFRIPPPNHEPDTTPLSPADLRLYQQQLGCLLFAAVTCRLDLSYIASQLAQYLRRPEGENLADLRRALQYFISTPDVGLTYKANLTTPLQLTGYVDADHAGDADNRRSRTGFIFKLEPARTISWKSNKQEHIALSSAEAEFIAASAAVREGLYLTELLQETKTAMNGSFKLLCDNQSAIKIANKPGFVSCTKHIALRYFFVKDEIDKGKVLLIYCPTGKMAADFLTKKLPCQKFQYCSDLCGVTRKSHLAHLQE